MIDEAQHCRCFETLANSLRLQLLTLLHEGPKSVNQLAQAASAERSRVSHSLQMLRNCSLVSTEKVGREVRYALNDASPLFNGSNANVFTMMQHHAKACCDTCTKTGRKPYIQE